MVEGGVMRGWGGSKEGGGRLRGGGLFGGGEGLRGWEWGG